MDPHRPRIEFDATESGRETVLHPEVPLDLGRDPRRESWIAAAGQAREAYDYWRGKRDAESYAVYRACADRADAAQDGLSAQSRFD